MQSAYRFYATLLAVPQSTVSGPQHLLAELAEKFPAIKPAMYADDLTFMIHCDTLDRGA